MKIVIIGNGPAAVTAVETIRELDQACEITMIAKEEGPCYSPCPLAEYVEGSVSRDGLFIRDDGFYTRLNITTIFGREAISIDTEEKQVVVATEGSNKRTSVLRKLLSPFSPHIEPDAGERIPYDRLLIASGASAFFPPIPGLKDKKGVFALKTLADADDVLAAVKSGAKQAVVIGSGFIGLEAAQALVRRGLSVTVLENQTQVLPNMLDADMAADVQLLLEREGIDIRLNAQTEEVIGDSQVNGIRVDGEVLFCDLVVCATGVRADASIARGTKITVNRGIVVDQTMETSAPGVFAAGDIIETEGIDGKQTVIPTWPNAVNSGRIAGYNMTGVTKHFTGLELINVLRVFDVPIGSFGALEGERVLEWRRGDVRKKLAIKGDRISGLQVIGDINNMGLFLEMMKKGRNISNLEENILDPGFGYANTFTPVAHKSAFNMAAE